MIYFIDLDGVIIDSAKECYLVSKFVYYKNKKFNYDEDKYSKLFYKYRGLVGPAGGFELLHSLIEKKFKDNRIDLYFYNYKNIAYNQLGKNFIKNLSFLDLLFNLGKDSRRFIKKNFFLMKDKNI